MAIEREGNKVYIRGSVTVDNVVEITQQGMSLLDDDNLIVDLGGIAEVDSSAVSMLFEWLRMAQARSQQLQLVNIPENLNSLVQLYGVTDFILPDTFIVK
jgi:phospholipid transport system transporter-binding protein